MPENAKKQLIDVSMYAFSSFSYSFVSKFIYRVFNFSNISFVFKIIIIMIKDAILLDLNISKCKHNIVPNPQKEKNTS